MRISWKLGAAAALVLAAGVGLAQAPGIKRTILQRVDVAGSGRECVFGTAELAPGATSGKHIHHGVELGYIVEGEAEILVDGQPPRKLKAGDSFRIEVEQPHEGRNAGSAPLKILSSWVVEKGKPLAEPVK